MRHVRGCPRIARSKTGPATAILPAAPRPHQQLVRSTAPLSHFPPAGGVVFNTQQVHQPIGRNALGAVDDCARDAAQDAVPLIGREHDCGSVCGYESIRVGFANYINGRWRKLTRSPRRRGPAGRVGRALPGDQPFSSRLSALRNCQSVPSEAILLASRSRFVSAGSYSRHLLYGISFSVWSA